MDTETSSSVKAPGESQARVSQILVSDRILKNKRVGKNVRSDWLSGIKKQSFLCTFSLF